MKNTIKNIAMTALTAATLTSVSANDNQYRILGSYSEDLNNNFTSRTTFGIAPDGSYDGAPIPLKGQFLETFRAYDVFQESNGKDMNYIPLGIRLPKFSIGGIESKVLAFGSLGDIAGIGLESEHKLSEKDVLTLNAEMKDDKSSRLGLGLSHQLTSNLNLGVGYDNVNSGNTQFNQYFVNGVLDLSKRTSIGLAFVTRDNLKNTDYSVGAFLVTSGNKDQWGTFSDARLDWKSNSDEKNITWESYFSQNPSTDKNGATWSIGRGVNGDDTFNPSILPLSVSRFETIAPYDRSFGGLTFDSRGSFNTKTEAGSISTGISYSSPKPINNQKFGVTLEERHAFSKSGDSDYFEPQAIWRIKSGKHYWGPSLGVSIPISGKDNITTLKGVFLYTF